MRDSLMPAVLVGGGVGFLPAWPPPAFPSGGLWVLMPFCSHWLGNTMSLLVWAPQGTFRPVSQLGIGRYKRVPARLSLCPHLQMQCQGHCGMCTAATLAHTHLSLPYCRVKEQDWKCVLKQGLCFLTFKKGQSHPLDIRIWAALS